MTYSQSFHRGIGTPLVLVRKQRHHLGRWHQSHARGSRYLRLKLICIIPFKNLIRWLFGDSISVVLTLINAKVCQQL